MTINHNDFMPESGRLRADIGHALERIAGIVGEIDSTMTVGEIVRLSYLQGVGDTLHAFGRFERSRRRGFGRGRRRGRGGVGLLLAR